MTPTKTTPIKLSATDVVAVSSALRACWDNYKTLKARYDDATDSNGTAGPLSDPMEYMTTGYILELRHFLGERFKLVKPIFSQYGGKVSKEYAEKQTRNGYALGDSWIGNRLTNLWGFSESVKEAKMSFRKTLLDFEVAV